MIVLDGKQYALELLEALKKKIEMEAIRPELHIVLANNAYASKLYVKKKVKSANHIGIKTVLHIIGENQTTDDLIELIKSLNNDLSVAGIMVQLPMYPKLNRDRILRSIKVEKDVDGLSPKSLGYIFNNGVFHYPATSLGIIKLLKKYNIKLIGREVCLIGGSNYINIPLVPYFLKNGSTVTICTTNTKSLRAHTLVADIIVSATGVSHLVKGNDIKAGVVCIDVGITQDENGKLSGDFDYNSIKSKASYVSPVPGGVGPMTVYCLLENTYNAYKLQNSTTK